MARFLCSLIGVSILSSAVAKRTKPSLEGLQKEKDACDDVIAGAAHRECYTRASFGLLPGFNTCGAAICGCDADSVITGEDDACNAALYHEGRDFDPEVLRGKGCACEHKANTMTCSATAPQVCHQCKYKTKTAKIADFANMDEKADETFPMRIGLPEHGLPESMQGVYWLTDQAASSSLVSFARSEDGGGLSVLDPNTGIFKVRVSGDRVWSFSDLGGNFDSVRDGDLVYEFDFDSATKPTEARITPEARKMNNVLNWAVGQSWILAFDMYLLDCAKNPDDEHCKDAKFLPGFEESFVWQRKSYVLGVGITSKDYKAVQVIKADGTKLPAFKHWMEFSNSDAAGDTPGGFHYREVDNSINCE